MFTKSAAIYDAIHAARFDAAAAASTGHTLIQAHKQTTGNALLDVACGTGANLLQLRSHYSVEGSDLDPGMLAVAHQKLPDVPFHQADLGSFDLNRRFDAVLCLGSSIGYIDTLDRLRQAVATFARHTCRVAGASSSDGSAPSSRDCARNRDANGRDERDGTHGSTGACRAEVELRPVSSRRISPCDGASIYDSSTIPRLQRRRS